MGKVASTGQTLGGINVKIGADNEELVKKLNESSAELSRTFKDVGKFTQSIGEMKREYRELSRMSLMGKTPDEIREVDRRLAVLKDDIGDYNNKIKSMSLDPFEKVAQGIQVASSMMAGLTGAVSLFGGETEKMQALMQKTVALIAIAQAAQQAAVFTSENAIGIYIKEKTKELALKVKDIFTIKEATAATVAQAGATEGAASASKVAAAAQRIWNGAVNSFPAMAIITAVAAIGAGIVVLVSKLREHNREMAKAKGDVDALAKASKDLADSNARNANILQAQGADERVIRENRQAAIKKEIEALTNERVALAKLFFIQKDKDDKEKTQAEWLAKNAEIKKLNDEYELLAAQNKLQDMDRLNEAYLRQLALQKEIDRVNKEKRENKGLAEIKSIVEVEYKLKIKTDNDGLKKFVDGANEMAAQAAQTVVNKITDISQVMNGALTELANIGVTSMASAIGSIAAGANPGEVFKGIGEQLINFTESLGKALIAAGIGSLAFKKLFFKPGLAIAAGAALLVAASFVKQKLQAGPGGSESGGGGGGAMPSYGGSSGGAGGGFSSPSYATPSNTTEWSNRTITNNGASMVVTGELVARGSELVAVINREMNRLTY